MLLLETIARLPLDRLPSTWVAELRCANGLDSDDGRIVRQAVECLRDGRVAEFAPAWLLKLAADADRPKDLRVAALAAAARASCNRSGPDPFQFLCAAA